jgi:hypothetical protein
MKRVRIPHGEIVLLFFVSMCFLLISLYKLDTHMPFIGDQAWFYLSARDMLSGHIPLVGITSSHTWLHQGPLWTYLLAGSLWLGKFHPVSGALLTIGISLLTLITLYKVTAALFNKNVGYIALLLYTFSPLVIENARFAYHTSPIPLFSLLFLFAFFTWTKGEKRMFPFVILLLSILYNFELATVVLIFLVIGALFLGKLTKAAWSDIFTRRILLRSLLYAAIPMIPVLMYDLSHGFAQTVLFAGWLLVYKPSQFLFGGNNGDVVLSITSMVSYLWTKYQQLVSLGNSIIAAVLLIGSIATSIWIMHKKHVFTHGVIVLGITTLIAVISFIFNKTPSDAYMPLLYPWVIMFCSIFLYYLLSQKQKFVVVLGGCLLFSVVYQNLSEYTFDDYTLRDNVDHITLTERVATTEQIIRLVGKRPFIVVGTGEGSEFESFVMPYEYLLWWKGYAVSENPDVRVVVSEKSGKISVGFEERSNKVQ